MRELKPLLPCGRLSNVRLFVVVDHPDKTGALQGLAMGDGVAFGLRKELEAVGINWEDIYVTAFVKKETAQQDKENLQAELTAGQPEVILSLGWENYKWLTGFDDLDVRRGSEEYDCSGRVVIGSYDLAEFYANPEKKHIFRRDLRRVKTCLEDKRKASDVYPEDGFILEPSFAQVEGFLLSKLRGLRTFSSPVSFDIETRAGHISCLGLGDEKNVLVVPFMTLSDFEGYWTFEEEVEVVAMLQAVMTHKNFQGIGQNVKYDCEYIKRHWGFFPTIWHDTLLGHHFLVNSASGLGADGSGRTAIKKNLGFLSSLYHPRHRYWKDGLHSTDEKEYWLYNARDVANTYTVAIEQQKRIKNTSEKRQEAHQHLQDLILPTLKMTETGIRINAQAKKKYMKDLKGALAERQKWLDSVCGHELNFRSSKQMKELLYTDCRLPTIKKRGKAGSAATVSCDAKSLKDLRQKAPQELSLFFDVIDSMRSIGVFLGTFLDYKESPDKRIRCAYNIAGTKTNRFAHTKNAFGEGTNLANVPKYEENSVFTLPDIRALFIPDEGMEYGDSDLDSADLRIVQAESQCKVLGEMLDAGLKPYVEIAKEYYKDPTINKNHPSYKKFKMLAHGTHYLGKASEMARNTGLLTVEVEKIQKWYFGLCPEIKEWQEKIKNQIVGRKWIENIFGYRLNFLGHITNDSYKEGIAWIPQSTVAGIINRVLIRVYKELPQVVLLNQVHDSLNFQFPIENREGLLVKLIEAGKVYLPYEPKGIIVPLGIKTSKTSWGNCE